MLSFYQEPVIINLDAFVMLITVNMNSTATMIGICIAMHPRWFMKPRMEQFVRITLHTHFGIVAG